MDFDFVLFLCTKKMTVLPICQDDNLIVGRKIILLKSGYYPI